MSLRGLRKLTRSKSCEKPTMTGEMTDNYESKNHFTYIWTIENASDLIFEKLLFSPVFIVKSMAMTQWRLGLITFGPNINFHVYRIKNSGEPEQIKIHYKLSFLGQDGQPCIEKADTGVFLRSGHREFPEFAKTDDVFSLRKAEFLPKDVLTVRCRMWRKDETSTPLDVCYAHTRFGMDRHRFVWVINDFSSLPLRRKTTRVLKSNSEGSPDHTLCLSLRESNGKGYVCIDFEAGVMGTNDAVKGEVGLLNIDGEVVQHRNISRCIEERRVFLNAFIFELKTLLSQKSVVLPNDTLYLRCEFAVCYGPLWSKIESASELESSVRRAIRMDAKDTIVEEPVEPASDNCPFKQNVHRFYEDGTLSDVSLRADSVTFPVHKIILCTRSPVFKAMFSNDMREKASRCIDVPDIGADTLKHLLLYIYTNEVAELKWDETADLLRAADKYELLELKKHCSATLKSNLSSANIFSLLSLADMHQEEDLYNAVLDFVSHNFDIFSSEAWKTFKKENSDLAMRAMERIICIKNFR